MKKFLILPILITPMVAKADNVGPAAVGQGETPVVATASAPYTTATIENGDSTQVVSASYVKGAFNDAIATVNKVNSDKQDKLVTSIGENIQNSVVQLWGDVIQHYLENKPISNGNTRLITADGAMFAGMFEADSMRVKAVTAWGDDDNTTQLRLERVYPYQENH